MKKSTSILLLILLPFCLFASDFQGAELPEDTDLSYAYSSFALGYGFSAVKTDNGTVLSHNVDFALDYGFVAMATTSKLGFGFGGRTDVLYCPSDNPYEEAISVHTMLGPQFVFPISRYLNINLLVGPVFSFYSSKAYGTNDSLFTMGPAVDASAELLFPGFSSMSFKAGLTSYGSFGLGNSAIGASIIPYAAFTFKFGPEAYFYSPIYYYPVYYPYYYF